MKIIATMIIKDEEKNLHRCLGSIKDLIDDIVIVDTGSTDKSIEIAKSYGAYVYNQPWQNDFSFHRNYSIYKATEVAGGKDFWFFVIDGDEELHKFQVTKDQFKERLNKLPERVSGLAMTVYEVEHNEPSMYWTGTRFFRSDRNFHYENIIHNKAKVDGLVAGTDMLLYHYGYSDKKVMAKKRDRTLPLLLERIENDPEDYNALFYACLTTLGKDDYQTGIDYGVKCLEIIPVSDPRDLNYYGLLYYSIGWGYIRLNDFDHAHNWFMKGLSFFPNDIDLNYGMAQIGYFCGKDEILKEHGNKYLQAVGIFKEKMELNFPKFENAFKPDEATVSQRHVHRARDVNIKEVKKWMDKAGVYESTEGK